ncbi:pSer/pThr/pTyr-binding forkhead associated (FHA) protein [Clostridium saccharoperbutylacetonicum]|uniref:Forkhead-associated (FHA) domain-containing protein n=1 Tax=Clostridium saccharoperbutylacetonicum N1-4(HMT) TaxID=931276 RepID=M1MXL1_9CLOT|nr:FHA domain-containing protein [Clostridium saccharoperbutylacetonicum]AGF59261.1 forkhead-associated (FHA) domain-containing protein [Clostridium saccharoperbutylacetonicum N1-4(HMT)]NRT59951.1 pSer/pThr/pTyr-binding forkhead associated (FHA) protein [Clostridium saccharoperbutylacetonicum]NSB23263.1 pSer/pThr/pTyr-binding forkhead associated (FHA) protein [Clostridium saccharoperbutylacetonicum]NSB42633.1 pSer/pThr/pTyr-binding forkhead associated (FHA) protein [Clostridium saccharoperbutyl
MSFSKIIAGIFGLVFIVILYVIIYYALKIMYKDVKNGGKKRRPTVVKGNYGLEIMSSGSVKELKEGSIIPIRSDLTIGRKGDNLIVLNEQHISGNHAKILVRNDSLFLEDLNSTNGTYLNGTKITGKVKLSNKDEIKIGNVIFKILG